MQVSTIILNKLKTQEPNIESVPIMVYNIIFQINGMNTPLLEILNQIGFDLRRTFTTVQRYYYGTSDRTNP